MTPFPLRRSSVAPRQIACSRSPFARTLRLLIAASLLSVAATGQDEPQPEPPQPSVPLLARQFRQADSLEARRELGVALLTRGIEGREALAESVERMLGTELRDFEKDLRSHRRSFEATAAKLLRSRLDRRTQVRIDQLRDECRALRSGELTKEIVQSEIDPRVAELREVLWLELDAVFTAEERLIEQSSELEAELDALELLEEFRAAARSVEDDAILPDLEPVDPDRDPLVSAGGVRGLRQALEQAHQGARLRALPIGSSDRAALDANDDLRGQLDFEELDGVLALNELRLVLGLSAVRIDTRLCDACRDHSKDMAELGFFAHESPVEGKRSFADRAANFGTSASAENIAKGHRQGRGAIRGWWYSPGHHKNMMRSAGRVGLGHHEGLWTQLFGG